MRIGVRAHDYGRHDVKEYAGLLRQEGYETVQLAIPKAFTGIESYDAITEELLYEIKTAFEANQLQIAVLGCYQDLSNPDPNVRARAVAVFGSCLRYSRFLNAKLTGTETSYAHLSKMEKHLRFPYMMDSLKRLAEEAERLDTWLGIEPVAWHPLEDIETTREVLDALKSDHVKIILDPANLLERPELVDQKAYWKYCFALLGDAVEAIHLKDFVINEKGAYEPRLLGQGVMDYTVLQEWLQTRPHMPVLREEMDPQTAGVDLAFMRALMQSQDHSA